MSFIGLISRARASILLFSFLSVGLVGCGGKDSADSAGAGLSQCEADTQRAVAENTDKQMNFYRQYGSTLPLPSHQAKFYPGTNGRAVVLVHGFISSPDSMTDLAQSFNGAGYTVIAPLLTGFGDGPDAANAANVSDWKGAVDDAVRIARLCHNDVSLVAHSLGTSLATLELGDATDRDVNRVVLLAPFFKTHSKWMEYLAGIVSLGSDTIYISSVERYLGMDPYEIFDLERPTNGEREPYLPLKAMREVLSLQDVFAKPAERKLDVPVLAFITEADAIVDGKYATTYLSNHFRNAQFVVYPESDKIEHSFQSRKFNPNYDTMVNQILAYIAGDASVEPTPQEKLAPALELAPAPETVLSAN